MIASKTRKRAEKLHEVSRKRCVEERFKGKQVGMPIKRWSDVDDEANFKPSNGAYAYIFFDKVVRVQANGKEITSREFSHWTYYGKVLDYEELESLAYLKYALNPGDVVVVIAGVDLIKLQEGDKVFPPSYNLNGSTI